MITNDPVRRTTLLIRERLWRAAKISAFRQGRDLQDVVSEALETYLSGRQELEPEPAGAVGEPKLGRGKRSSKKGGDRR